MQKFDVTSNGLYQKKSVANDFVFIQLTFVWLMECFYQIFGNKLYIEISGTLFFLIVCHLWRIFLIVYLMRQYFWVCRLKASSKRIPCCFGSWHIYSLEVCVDQKITNIGCFEVNSTTGPAILNYLPIYLLFPKPDGSLEVLEESIWIRNPKNRHWNTLLISKPIYKSIEKPDGSLEVIEVSSVIPNSRNQPRNTSRMSKLTSFGKWKLRFS